MELSKRIMFLLTVVPFLAIAGIGYQYWLKPVSTLTIPAHLQGIGGDFVLRSASGPVSLKDFRGKIAMVFFGYTNCPDICPMALTHWTTAFNMLSEGEQKKVSGLFVSVDPARDTPEVLKSYTEYFHPSIVGVTGSHEELRKIAAQYRSDYHLENEGRGDNYTVDHMSFVYVIGKEGRVRDLLSHDSSPEDVVNSIRKLL